MEGSDVPADVQRFLHEQLDSLEQLEILLLLRRRGEGAWSSQQVADDLRIRDSVAEEALEALSGRGLLERMAAPGSVQFHYRPRSAALAELIERLDHVYANQRVAILRLMTANAIERLRSGALSLFANAFVFGKRDKPRG